MSRWAYPAGAAEDVTFHGGVQDELDVEGMFEREKQLEYQEAYSPLRQVWKEAILLFPDNDDPEDPNNIGDLLDEIASQRVITEGVRPVHDGDPPPTCTKDTRRAHRFNYALGRLVPPRGKGPPLPHKRRVPPSFCWWQCPWLHVGQLSLQRAPKGNPPRFGILRC